MPKNRLLVLILSLMISQCVLAEVIVFKDTGRVASDPIIGMQFWGSVDISGLRYERTTTVDTAIPGATYEDGSVPYDNSGYWVRSIIGGTFNTTYHGAPRPPSPAIVSYAFTVFTAADDKLFTFTGIGDRVSQMLLSHRESESTATNLVVQADSPPEADIYTYLRAISQLQLMGLTFSLPEAGRFIDAGIYQLQLPSKAGSSGNAVAASHFLNPWTSVEDLRAVLMAEQVVISISSVPEPASWDFSYSASQV